MTTTTPDEAGEGTPMVCPRCGTSYTVDLTVPPFCDGYPPICPKVDPDGLDGTHCASLLSLEVS